MTDWFAISRADKSTLYYNSMPATWTTRVQFKTRERASDYHAMAREMFNRIYFSSKVDGNIFVVWKKQ